MDTIEFLYLVLALAMKTFRSPRLSPKLLILAFAFAGR
jgi:hypothetical protein